VAIRSLAHAAEILTDRHEQEEVLQIFDKINKETGWRIGFVYEDLKKKWKWNEGPSPQQYAQSHTGFKEQKKAQEEQQKRQLQEGHAQNLQLQQTYANANGYTPQPQQQQQLPTPQQPQPQQKTTPPSSKRPPPGIPNPLYAKADFNLPQHPYMNHYVAPNMPFGNGQALGQGLPGGYYY